MYLLSDPFYNSDYDNTIEQLNSADRYICSGTCIGSTDLLSHLQMRFNDTRQTIQNHNAFNKYL